MCPSLRWPIVCHAQFFERVCLRPESGSRSCKYVLNTLMQVWDIRSMFSSHMHAILGPRLLSQQPKPVQMHLVLISGHGCWLSNVCRSVLILRRPSRCLRRRALLRWTRCVAW